MNAHPKPIDSIRGFNRFYTRQLGLLDSRLLGSEFTLTESRVLYEIATHANCTATEIARELGLDLGYLSRVLKSFERRQYIQRGRSEIDARQQQLNLTKKGRAAFDPLNRAAKDQITRMLKPLDGAQRRALVEAMHNVQHLLQPCAEAPVPYEVRTLQIGDIGWITHRQGKLYAEEYGWDGTYEALVAEILANFVKHFDSSAERGWVAVRDHGIVGSIFLVRASAKIAKLRLLYVEPSARGLGIGRNLVGECIDFAKACGYTTLTLWTDDGLVAARRIYESAGFVLTKEERHHSFGKDLTGQTWDLALA
jgi:DNA-binding MarR family transcriptional regulator/GNAT superfamily N-acetyltransferase